MLEPATGRYATVLTGAGQHLSFDRDGAVWVGVDNDIVKLRLDAATSAMTTSAPGLGGAIGEKRTTGGGAAVHGPPVTEERTAAERSVSASLAA